MWVMHTAAWIFAAGWTLFLLYWLLAAFSTKRGRIPWARELPIRAALLVAVIVLVRVGAFRHRNMVGDDWRAAPGLLLFALGLAFAIWAPVHIGGNWGGPRTEKGDPALVTRVPTGSFVTRSTRASCLPASVPRSH